MRVLANTVNVVFQEKSGKVNYYDIIVLCSIDEHGYVETKSTEDALTLVDLDVAEWRAIGPEDSEIFLKDEWMVRLRIGKAIRELERGWIDE